MTKMMHFCFFSIKNNRIKRKIGQQVWYVVDVIVAVVDYFDYNIVIDIVVAVIVVNKVNDIYRVFIAIVDDDYGAVNWFCSYYAS